MRLQWTDAAAADLRHIVDRLYEENPVSAPTIARRIYNPPDRLTMFPDSGRRGRQRETRELVIPALPGIMVYDIAGDRVRILRILHGAQKWPWSSHFEFADDAGRRIRCDLVSRPPRLSSASIEAMFRSAADDLIVVDRESLIRLKQTGRAKDYAAVGELQQTDRKRVAAYQRAAAPYLDEFRRLALDTLPLERAHEEACRIAEALLPNRAGGA